jgi:hypothetical protein
MSSSPSTTRLIPLVFLQANTHVFQFFFSIGIGLLYAATVFHVLAPLPPSLAGQALAFLVFVRNFGNILGITIGASFLITLNKKLHVDGTLRC